MGSSPAELRALRFPPSGAASVGVDPSTPPRPRRRRLRAALPWIVGFAALAGLAAYVVWRQTQPQPSPVQPATHRRDLSVTEFPRDPELQRATQLINALDAALEDYTLA